MIAIQLIVCVCDHTSIGAHCMIFLKENRLCISREEAQMNEKTTDTDTVGEYCFFLKNTVHAMGGGSHENEIVLKCLFWPLCEHF